MSANALNDSTSGRYGFCMSNSSRRRFLSLLFVLSLPTAAVAGWVQTTSPTVTYLANMGVQITGTTSRIVIDGFHRGALAMYAPLRAEDQASLEGATGAHAHLDAILITHRHYDHFQAAAVAARLAVDSQVRVIAPLEVMDSLVAFAPTLRRDARLIVAVPGTTVSIGDASVLTLDLPHNPTPSVRAQNVGYLVTIEGVRVLHVGDANPDAGQMRSILGTAPRVDIAIVPFWYLTPTQPSLMQAIGATRYLAAHIPLIDTVSVKRQLASAPLVTALATRGATMSLSPR